MEHVRKYIELAARCRSVAFCYLLTYLDLF